jgi:hypothetical protein
MEFVHPAELDAPIEGSRGETACLDAGAAGPERHVGMASDLARNFN